MSEIPIKRPSIAWYLLPIALGLLGGLIMFFVLRGDNRKMAKKGLVLGVVLSVMFFVFVGVITVSSPSGDPVDSSSDDENSTAVPELMKPVDDYYNPELWTPVGSVTTFRDSTGYMPDWPKTMGQWQAHNKCYNLVGSGAIEIDSKDDNWCREFQGYTSKQHCSLELQWCGESFNILPEYQRYVDEGYIDEGFCDEQPWEWGKPVTTFRDSTGYMPDWPKTMGEFDAWEECYDNFLLDIYWPVDWSVVHVSKDDNWCREFQGYVDDHYLYPACFNYEG